MIIYNLLTTLANVQSNWQNYIYLYLFYNITTADARSIVIVPKFRFFLQL
jgi:hypothetical protein